MIWRFRDFELDEVRFELRRRGERVALAPKPLALLLHLAKRYPASVTRDELLRLVWPGVRVTGASVARAVLAARRAIGDDADEAPVIRTVRGRGYAFADLGGLDAGRLPSPVPALAAPFVGRAAELARIEAALDHVEVGRGRVLCISGEPGIGKTRLVDEIATRARARGAVVLTGYCREDDGAPPYWPWPEILRNVMYQRDDPALRQAIEPLLLDLTPTTVPASRAPARAAVSDADGRFRFVHAVVHLLREAARRRPLIVLIEDLHWARSGTLHLLRFAARSLADAPVLLTMTFRTSGPPPHAALADTVGEIAALSHALPVLALGGFSADEIADYVRAVTARPPDVDLVRRLEETAGGNPLFLRELVPLFTAADAGQARVEPMPIPPSVAYIVRAHAARLPGATRELLEIAAVIGRAFAPRLVARAGGRRLETVLEHLAEARRAELIAPHGSGGLYFRHDIIRAALYDALPPARRIELHRRVGRAIETDPATHEAAELAHHFVEAVSRAGVEKAVAYAMRAAEAARRAVDFDGAVLHYRRALAVLGDHKRPALRCDVLLGLSEVLEVTGQLAALQEAVVAAAEIARRLRSFARLGRAALAITAWQFVLIAEPVAVRLVEDALRAVGRRRIALRVRLLAKLAVLRNIEGRDPDAWRLLRQARALSRRLRDPALHCDALVHQLHVMQYGIPRDHAARLAFTDTLLAAAQRAGSTNAILHCRRHRLAIFLDAGMGPELDEEIAQFERASTAARCKLHWVAAFRAMRAIVCGRFDEARRAIDEAEALADPCSPEDRRFTPTAQRIALPPEYRDTQALAQSIAGILNDLPQVVSWCAGQILVALDLGHMEGARAILQRMGADEFASVPRDSNYVVVLTSLAAAAWRLGARRYAGCLHTLLLPHSGAHATAGFGVGYQGPVDWYLGVLAMTLKRRREAARHFRIALATTERLGAWPWHARTELAYATLLATGPVAERARAHSLADSAATAAARFGMQGMHAEADRLCARLGRR